MAIISKMKVATMARALYVVFLSNCVMQTSHAFLTPHTTASMSHVQNHRAGILQHTARIRIRRGETKGSNLDNFGDGNDEESEELFFDDFGDFVIGGDDAASSASCVPSSLQERIRETQQQEIFRDTKLMRNWKQGDWMVRGFSLDTDDAISPESTDIYVTCLAADVNSDGQRIWVARSNGSLLWVQLGTEYTTHFRSKITGNVAETSGDAENSSSDDDVDTPSNLSAKISSELVRDEGKVIFADGNQESTPQDISSQTRPFSIVGQFSPAPSDQKAAQITTILSVTDESFIFTADQSGKIQQWHISDDWESSVGGVLTTPIPLSDTVHSESSIVTLKAVSYGDTLLLLSVGANGSLALWDLVKADLIFVCQAVTGNEQILGADVHQNQIFVGTASGDVLGFDVGDLMTSAAASGSACPVPRCRFVAHQEEGGVTAIACGGLGSLGRGGQTRSTVLVTGGGSGMVKQWEILADPSNPSRSNWDNWPKMATQRLPKKAHLFVGHSGAVSALKTMDGRRPLFLSASVDGTIRAWSAETGKEEYRMDGFTSHLSSLCLQGGGIGDPGSVDADMLITNGMKNFVCLHDFSMNTVGESVDKFLDFDE